MVDIFLNYSLFNQVLFKNTYLAKNLIANRGKVARLKMRSEEHNDIMNGVSVCSLVFLWYITAHIIKRLNVNPPKDNSKENAPPKFASVSLYMNGVESSFEVSFHQHMLVSLSEIITSLFCVVFSIVMIIFIFHIKLSLRNVVCTKYALNESIFNLITYFNHVSS